MRVWVVEIGKYSDRSILGVFSSKEKADEVVALATRHTFRYREEPNDPEEFEVDAPVRQRLRFSVYLHLDDGLPCAAHGALEAEWGAQDDEPYVHECYRHPTREIVYGGGRSPEAAWKAAYDFRARILAERAGIV